MTRQNDILFTLPNGATISLDVTDNTTDGGKEDYATAWLYIKYPSGVEDTLAVVDYTAWNGLKGLLYRTGVENEEPVCEIGLSMEESEATPQ